MEKHIITRPQLLLVDDNQEILDFIADDLQDKYHIITAKDGVTALGILRDSAIQLVVSDVMMPEMDGFELCRQIKSDVEYSHIPVILLTARNTLQSKIEGLELGADAYIEKPFSPAHLEAQIASLLSNRQKVRDHFATSPAAHIRSMAISRADEAFLDKLHEIILQHLTDVNLDVEVLADKMNMSRPTLYRKIKVISDLTPHELISLTRLKKAAMLLDSGYYKVNEAAEMTGFASLNNFSRNFQKQFGMLPSEYLARK